MATTKAQTGYLAITIPCDNEQGAFIVERLHGVRIAVRIGKTVLFMTYPEAVQVAAAVASLMGPQAQSLVKP